MYSSEFQSSCFNLSDVLPSTRPSSISLVSGEYIRFTGKCLEGILTLTNYRLILQYSGGIYNVPLGVIDQTEIRKVVCLHACCKDARGYKCTFDSSDLCLDWQRKISDATASPLNLEQLFASVFYRANQNDNPELHSFLNFDAGQSRSYIKQTNKIFDDEVKRLGFDIRGSWKISKANENYELCTSYPRRMIIPSSISDKTLEVASKFRASRRIPTAVWRHSNGAVIARSSQPEVGWLWWRSSEDEDIVKALAEACAYDSPSTTTTSGVQPSTSTTNHNQPPVMENGDVNDKNITSVADFSSLCDLPDSKSQTDIKRLLIMDARSYATAVANRARGGGVECLEYYPTCEIQFMNLDNIHTIRKSHHALRNIITLPSDIPNWLTLLESTRWFYHMSGLLRSAVTVAQTIAVEGRPVLVHCSDGWDRTPQITALAEVLLDPYYRTMEGFRVLIEREWIEFGHKFSDRCGCGVGGSDDLNERCPIFLQWVDCIYQIQHQYPTAFQFNQAYLVKLVQHVYSNLFDTFLFNSSQERYINETQGSSGSAMYSIWPFFLLQYPRCVNHLYAHSDRVLYPSFHTKDLLLWKAIYVDKVVNPQDNCLHGVTEETSNKNKVTVEVSPPSGDLVKTKSCDSLLDQSPTSSVALTNRRSSDPNLSESLTDLELLSSDSSSKSEDGSNQRRRVSADGNSVKTHEPDRVPLNCKKKPQCSSSENLTTQRLLLTAIEDNAESPSCTSSPSNSVCTESLNSSRNVVCVDAKRSIEGSTDTLVAESGVISNENASVTPTAATNEQTAGNTRDKSFNSINRKLGNELRNVVVVNKILSQKNGKDRTLDETACHHTYSPYSPSSLITSNICGNCKKVLGDAAEIDTKKHSSGSDGSVNNGGAESRPQKSAPSTAFSSRTSSAQCDDSKHLPSHNQDESLCSSFSDGLSNYSDEVTQRLNQIRLLHQLEVESLRRELRATKSFYLHYIQTKLNQSSNEGNVEDQDSLPESLGSGSGESLGPESSAMSDASWEALEEGDLKTTLWVPDHAVDSCMNCHSTFWIGRRKHHCRSCGKIFCAECSQNSLPIPKENLYDPVRVCGSCFSSFLELGTKYLQVAAN